MSLTNQHCTHAENLSRSLKRSPKSTSLSILMLGKSGTEKLSRESKAEGDAATRQPSIRLCLRRQCASGGGAWMFAHTLCFFPQFSGRKARSRIISAESCWNFFTRTGALLPCQEQGIRVLVYAFASSNRPRTRRFNFSRLSLGIDDAESTGIRSCVSCVWDVQELLKCAHVAPLLLISTDIFLMRVGTWTWMDECLFRPDTSE